MQAASLVLKQKKKRTQKNKITISDLKAVAAAQRPGNAATVTSVTVT